MPYVVWSSLEAALRAPAGRDLLARWYDTADSDLPQEQ
jgi:hypothetical protein